MASALLDDYLERVGLTSARSPDLATLRRLHEAHVAAIPFENLDILLGHDIRLELDRLRDKLIARRRGGYCFEQNALFAAILQESGYTVMSMEARVRAGSTALRPRTAHGARRATRGSALACRRRLRRRGIARTRADER